MTLSTVFGAGQRVSASDLNDMVSAINNAGTILYAEKPTDQAILSTTALFDDASLVFSGLVASAKYLVIPKIFMRSAVGTDFKIGWSCSGTSATLLWSPKGLRSDATTTNAVEDHSQLTLADSYTYGTISAVATTQTAEPIGRLFTGTGTGITFKFRWAQGVSDGVNGTTLIAGSSITLIRTA